MRLASLHLAGQALLLGVKDPDACLVLHIVYRQCILVCEFNAHAAIILRHGLECHSIVLAQN